MVEMSRFDWQIVYMSGMADGLNRRDGEQIQRQIELSIRRKSDASNYNHRVFDNLFVASRRS